MNIYKTFLFLFLFVNTNAEEYGTTTTTKNSDSIASSTASNEDYEIVCNKTCAICGQNSISCVLNPEKCEIKCNCKSGFTGMKCEYQIPTTTTSAQLEAATSKDTLWLNIFNQINQVDLIELFKHMIYLLNKFRLTINAADIYNTNLILNEINVNYTLNIETINYLFDFIDLLISCNTNNNTIFYNANQYYNMSSLNLLNLIDNITIKFLISNNETYIVKQFNTFQLLISSLSSSSVDNSSSALVSSSNRTSMLNETFEMDSISLNATLLKQIFKNETINIILKIFYTIENNQNQTLTIESNDTSLSLKSNLFFDLNHPNYLNRTLNDAPFIISTTILSAILVHKTKSVHNLDTKTAFDEHTKFVRIQFTVKALSHDHERHLKCVYWDDATLKWSTKGCFKSTHESKFILNNRFYRKVCYCNHLTNFALLFDPNPYNSLENDDIDDLIFNYLLSIISYIGIIISLICYFIMIITRLFVKTFQQQQDEHENKFYKKFLNLIRLTILPANTSTNQQQFLKKPVNRGDYILRCLYLANISFLFLSNIFFILLTLITRTVNFNACIAIGLCLQYTLLASFCFSLGIAYQHFIKLILIFNTTSNKRKFLIKWFLVSLFLPVPFVVIEYFYDLKHTNNLNYNYCWLNEPYLYYLFVVPVLSLLLVSFVFYIICVFKICNLYCKCTIRAESKVDMIASNYNNKYVLSLLLFSMLSLSLTWLLGVFIVISGNLNNKVFNYLSEFFFCLFNSFHGISLLIGQYMAQKYSNFKSNYKLKETSKSSDTLRPSVTSTVSTASTTDGDNHNYNKNKQKVLRLLSSKFKNAESTRRYSSSRRQKNKNEIRVYNSIHVKNYGVVARNVNINVAYDYNGGYNIDNSDYVYYYEQPDLATNGMSEKNYANDSINVDYYINNNNEKYSSYHNSGYVVSLDAFTSSV